MATIILKNNKNDIFLIPDWTQEHIGLNNAVSGHTDIKKSSGSVFNSSVDKLALFEKIIKNPKTTSIGNLLQLNNSEPVGWSSLVDNSSGNLQPQGIILKQESPKGSKVASTIVAMAYTNPDFGNPDTQTNVFSAIAPPTTQIDYLPDDVKNNTEVLKAMEQGKLKTFISIFPGNILINGTPVPKASEMNNSTLFCVHPDNSQFIPCPKQDIEAFVSSYNEKSLSENKPSDLTADGLAIKKLIVKSNISFLRDKSFSPNNSLEKNQKKIA